MKSLNYSFLTPFLVSLTLTLRHLCFSGGTPLLYSQIVVIILNRGGMTHFILDHKYFIDYMNLLEMNIRIEFLFY